MKKLRDITWRRRNVPYCVVIHRPTGKAATYNRHYELISERASPELRLYVARVDRRFRTGFVFSWPEQRPTWLRPGMESECVRIFTYDDRDVVHPERLAAIPLK